MSNINYFDTDDSQGLLGHFIGKVGPSFWSSTLAESKGEQSWQGADKTKLFWNVGVEDVLQDGYEGVVPPAVTVNMGIGNGWWADETGLIVRHEDDPGDEAVEAGTAKPKLFKSSSLYGMFLDLVAGKAQAYRTEMGAAVVLDGGPDVEYGLNKLAAYMREHRFQDTRDATIWNDLLFEFRGLGLKYRNQEGDPRMKPYPVRFLGVGEVTESIKAPAASNTEDDAKVWVDFGASASTAATLVQLSRAATSHAEFARNALMLAEVKDDEKLSEAVADENNGRW